MTVYFGENLKRLRREKELTQEKLADVLGVSFQAVSKWERGETYPDITMLPEIAAFFEVSTDEILGLNTAEQEEKIKWYSNEYSRLWSERKLDEVKELMLKATKEFPSNYDLLSKHFNVLIQAHGEAEYKLAIKNDVQRIYDKIQSFCTDDRIRMWTKKMMCKYLRDLSLIEGSGVDISEAEKILEELPIMQNTRDYEAMYLYVNDKKKRNMAVSYGVSELLRLLAEVMQRKFDHPTEYDENLLEAFIEFIEKILPDGDYGKNYVHVIWDYGYLGVKKHMKGEDGKAMECFEKCVELAEKFDSLPEISTHTSFLLEGLDFDKTKTCLGVYKMKDRMKFLFLNRYPLSDEFKEKEEFKKLLERLEA